jgi:RecA/RadA recombinase
MARKRDAEAEKPVPAKKSAKEDLIGSIVSAIRASAPKKGDEGYVYVTRMNQGDKIFSAVREVVTTGLDPFDDIVGPIPKGRVVEVFGPESSGKSEFLKKVIKRAWLKELYTTNPDGSLDKIGDDTQVVIHVFDNENSFANDTDEIVIDGIKIDGILEQCDTIEDMWKNMHITLDKVKSARQNEMDKVKRAEKEHKTYKPKKFLTIFAIDTIASMTSIEEFSADWGGQDYPRMPIKLKMGFRRIIRRIANENVIALFSNQGNERFQKKGERYTPMDQKYSAMGGKALKFFSSLRVCFEKQDFKFVLDDDYRFQQGYVIAFVATKNRIKKPLREGRLVLLFDSAPNIYGEMTPSGLNNEYSILETLLYLKFVTLGDDKCLYFKFKEQGLTTTTFTGLEDDEDPSIPAKSDWVNFFAAHHDDIKALWNKAVDYIHKDRGLTNVKVIDAKPDVITGDEEPQEAQDIPVEEPPLTPQAPRVGLGKGSVLSIPE